MGIVCEHGQLKRSCPLCEKDEQIAALKQRCKELEADIDNATAAINTLMDANAVLEAENAELRKKKDGIQE